MWAPARFRSLGNGENSTMAPTHDRSFPRNVTDFTYTSRKFPLQNHQEEMLATSHTVVRKRHPQPPPLDLPCAFGNTIFSLVSVLLSEEHLKFSTPAISALCVRSCATSTCKSVQCVKKISDYKRIKEGNFQKWSYVGRTEEKQVSSSNNTVEAIKFHANSSLLTGPTSFPRLMRILTFSRRSWGKLWHFGAPTNRKAI